MASGVQEPGVGWPPEGRGDSGGEGVGREERQEERQGSWTLRLAMSGHKSGSGVRGDGRVQTGVPAGP